MKNINLQKDHIYPALRDEVLEIIFNDRVKFMSLLSSAVVHEMQTPLNIVKGLVDSLLTNQTHDSAAKLREVLREIEHLLKHVSTMDHTPREILSKNKTKFAVRPLVDQAVSYFHKERLEKGIILYVEVDPTLLVESEPNRLKNILIALFQNSVDSFTIKDPLKPRCITVHATQQDEKLHLIVSDTGIGMNADKQKRILSDNDVMSQLPKNSGLSLALAQKIANDLDIEMSFVSEDTKGTSFTLTFKTYQISKN